jgi:hypothetical protein
MARAVMADLQTWPLNIQHPDGAATHHELWALSTQSNIVGLPRQQPAIRGMLAGNCNNA